MEEDFDETTMDACLIAAGQRAEHYEMAAYGTLVAWAKHGTHGGRHAAAAEPSTRKRPPIRSSRRSPKAASTRVRRDAAHPDGEEEAQAAGATPGEARGIESRRR